MASLVTFGSIIEQAQQRADMVNSDFITSSEWYAMANSSLKNLYEKLIEAYGADYHVQTPYSFTTDGTSERFALPSDFFKLLGVDLLIGPNSATANGWVTIWKFNFAQRNQFTLPNILTLWGRTNLRYRLSGDYIWLTPTAQGSQTLRLWYAPAFQNLTLDADTFDGINGWEEWAINHIAKKALTKEESDTSGVDSLLAIEEERLVHVTENRDAGAAATVVDVSRANGYGDGYGNDWCP